MHFEDVEDDAMESLYMGEEVDGTGKGNGIEEDVEMMENMASGFSAFSNIYLIVLSKTPLPRRYTTPINMDNNSAAEEDMSMDEVVVTGGTKIPPPRRYSTTEGGAAPVNIRLERDQSEDNSMTRETPPRAGLHPRERKRHTKSGKIFDNNVLETVVHERPTGRKIYPQSSIRGYNDIRAARLVCLYIFWMGPSHIALDRSQGLNEPAYEHHRGCANS